MEESEVIQSANMIIAMKIVTTTNVRIMAWLSILAIALLYHMPSRFIRWLTDFLVRKLEGKPRKKP